MRVSAVRVTPSLAARLAPFRSILPTTLSRSSLLTSTRFLAPIVRTMASAANSSSLPSNYLALELREFARDVAGLAPTRQTLPSAAELSADEVLVQVEFASVNPSDVKNSMGAMSHTRLPRVLGRDFAGTVVAAGSSAAAQQLLQKSVFGSGGDMGFTRDGSHAEYIRLPAAAVVGLPKSLSALTAASIGVNFVTAYHGLMRGQLSASDIVLVNGANGGVGSAVVQLAKRAGAKTIGILRSKPQTEDPLLDAAVYLDAIPNGFKGLGEAVRALPLIQDAYRGQPEDSHHLRGATLAFDVLGGDVLPSMLDSLATRGRLVTIAMPLPHTGVNINGLALYRQEQSLLGVNSLLLDVVETATLLRSLASDFDSGVLKARDAGSIVQFPLDKVGEAYAAVHSGKVKGKAVIAFNQKANL